MPYITYERARKLVGLNSCLNELDLKISNKIESAARNSFLKIELYLVTCDIQELTLKYGNGKLTPENSIVISNSLIPTYLGCLREKYIEAGFKFTCENQKLKYVLSDEINHDEVHYEHVINIKIDWH